MSADSEREHAPTQKKLEDARRRGEVAQSAEITAAAAYAGAILAILIAGVWSVRQFGAGAVAFLDEPDRLSLSRDAAGGAAAAETVRLLVPALPFFAVTALATLAAMLAQRSIVIAPDRLAPRLSRIDPLAGAARKFGSEGLAEFLKSSLKLTVTGALLVQFLISRIGRIAQTATMSPGVGLSELAALTVEFLVLTAIVTAVFGAADYLWQRRRHHRRNRMSRQELVDEFRQSDGDPQVRQQRRQRARDIAANRMLADVPKADVVIVNPVHVAVALKWDRAAGRPPVCVAKGADEIAARIREAASLAGIPIRSDPPAARALHAALAVGQEISPEHYQAVAAAIRFAEAMRRRARRGAV